MHLLQLRVGRVSARTGRPLPGRAALRVAFDPMAVDARNRVSRRRHAQPDGAGGAGFDSRGDSGAPVAPKRPWKPRRADSTAEKIAAWRDAGINRVSLGVQSFVQKELARTRRRHTAEIVEQEIALLRAAGIESISVDLIAGLPGQTAASWSSPSTGSSGWACRTYRSTCWK